GRGVTRRRMLIALLVAGLAGTGYWVATQTEWVDVDIPMPVRGEARTNRMYAAQRFVEALGAHATRDLVLAVPPPSSVIVLSAWTWDLSAQRRDALERWVESGGRLVIDKSVTISDEFKRWSGIGYQYRRANDDDRDDSQESKTCLRYHEDPRDSATPDTHRICGFQDGFFLTTNGPPEW